jgi:hypothetical protein
MTDTMIFCSGCLTGMFVSLLVAWWMSRSLDKLNKW